MVYKKILNSEWWPRTAKAIFPHTAVPFGCAVCSSGKPNQQNKVETNLMRSFDGVLNVYNREEL